MDNNQLVQRFQNVQANLNRLQTERVRAQAELDLKKKDLANVEEQIKAMGIEPSNINAARDEAAQAFEKALEEAEMILNAIPKS